VLAHSALSRRRGHKSLANGLFVFRLTENKKPILTHADIEAIAVQYWTIVSELTLRPRAAIRLCFTRDVATNITATSKKMRFVSSSPFKHAKTVAAAV
jgi:hypothetical protein